MIERYRVPSANLVSAGYGRLGQKIAAGPHAAESRRVEIVNMVEREQASR